MRHEDAGTWGSGDAGTQGRGDMGFLLRLSLDGLSERGSTRSLFTVEKSVFE